MCVCMLWIYIRYIHCLADIHSFIALNNEFSVFKDVMKNILVMHVTYILWIIDVESFVKLFFDAEVKEICIEIDFGFFFMGTGFEYVLLNFNGILMILAFVE